MLARTIYISFLGAALLLLLPACRSLLARGTALVTTVAGLACALAGALAYQPQPGVVTVADLAWIPSLGIRSHLAADGISLTRVLL